MSGASMAELAGLLHGTLTAVGGARAAQEQRLTGLLHTPGFGLELCAFVLGPEVPAELCPPAIRQLACLLLKRLIVTHWAAPGSADDGDENDDGSDDANATTRTPRYVVGDAEKQQIRGAIVAALPRPEVLALYADSKLQTALCMAIVALFERDWPDQWPELLPVILGMLGQPSASSSPPLGVEVAVRFLALAGGHFSSDHCCELARVAFPALGGLFDASTTGGHRTRILRIVESTLLMVGMEAQVGNAPAQKLLTEHVTPWIGRLLAVLPAPVTQRRDLATKIQALQTLTKFIEEWPKHMTDVLPEILPQVFGLLVREAPAFEAEDGDDDAEAYDSDGEGTQLGRGAQAVAALELLRGVIQAPTKRTRQLVLGGLEDFCGIMITYMQITSAQMETWAADPNRYVADEDDESVEHSIRNTATDLLQELEDVLGHRALVAVLRAAQRRLQGPESTWRQQEAALLVVGTVATAILEATRGKHAAELHTLLDLSTFLDTLFQVMTGSAEASSTPIYLRARALWCAARLAGAMDSARLGGFLEVAISGLAAEQVLPVRLYACRAVGAIARHDTARPLLQEASGVVVERLIHLAELSTPETLHIALETLVVVLQELRALPPQAAAAVVGCFLRHWGANLNDPLLSELIDSAFGAVLELDHPEIIANLHGQVLPVLRGLLIQSRGDLGSAGTGATVAASALNVLKTLVKHSYVASSAAGGASSDPAMRAMSTRIVAEVFEPLVAVLEAVDDDKVLNAGAECLKWLVMFAVEPLGEYKCASGVSGIEAVMNVAAKLLSPSVDESCALCVGGLITQILLQLGAGLPTATIQSILHAVCERLAGAELPSLIQSLCMVFARLVHTHGRELLSVLEALPAPTPRHGAEAAPPKANMLEFVFSTWIERQPEFYGLYCIKVTISALLKVAEWDDPRITSLVVEGSEVPSSVASPTAAGGGIQTRSKTRSSAGGRRRQHTRVHFLTKLLIVLARVSTQLGEDEDEWEDSEDDESGDDEAEHDDVEAVLGGAAAGGSIFAPAEGYELLSDRLDASTAAVDGGDDDAAVSADEEEFEAHFDPLNDVDLKILIPAMLQSVSGNQELLQAVLPELTDTDKELLGAVTGSGN